METSSQLCSYTLFAITTHMGITYLILCNFILYAYYYYLHDSSASPIDTVGKN